MQRSDRKADHGLFSVQTKKRRAFVPARVGQVAQALGISLVILLLLWKGLYGLSASNLAAENAGLQGRKVRPGDKLQQPREDSPGATTAEEQRRYARMVDERMTYVDMGALAAVCRVPEDVSVNEKCTGIASISRHFHILGERHCGSNAAANLVHANFDVILESKEKIRKRFPWVKVAEFQREFGLNNHKHNSQQDDGRFYPGLTVISIRNPYDWVKSMMRDCYFCDSAQVRASRKGHLEFVSTPWQRGAHITPGESFEDIFDLRMKKFCNHLKSAITSSDCVMIVRAEENVLPMHQEVFVQRVQNLTGWAMKGETPTVLTGYHGRAQSGTSMSMLPKDYFDRSVYFGYSRSQPEEDALHLVEAVNAKMNPTFEKLLGYGVVY